MIIFFPTFQQKILALPLKFLFLIPITLVIQILITPDLSYHLNCTLLFLLYFLLFHPAHQQNFLLQIAFFMVFTMHMPFPHVATHINNSHFS